MRLPAIHRTVRELAALFASSKRFVRSVAEDEAELARLRSGTAEGFWALRDVARKKAAWRPLVKLICRR